MTEADPITFLRNAHERAEELAWRSCGGGASWQVGERADCDCCDRVTTSTGSLVTTADLDDAPHIAANSPAVVLRRVEAERAILAEHEPTWPGGEPEFGYHHETVVGEHGRTRYVEVRDAAPTPPYWCARCSTEAPCRTVRLLAAGWGWTEES